MEEQYDFKDFEKAVGAVNDPRTAARVAAIMAASYLEDYLARAVRTKLPGLNSTQRNAMFEHNGLLAAFGAKVDIASALGLINGAARSDLLKIAAIRNLFAHNIHIDSFSDQKVAALCGKLTAASDIIASRRKSTFISEAMKVSDTSPRGRFAWCAMMHCMAMHNYLVKYNHLIKLRAKAKSALDGDDLDHLSSIADQIRNTTSSGV